MNKKEHPLYSTWKNMKARCYVKRNSSYKYYGAKGVTVTERWHEFENFVYDIDNLMPDGHLIYKKEYQLDKDLKKGNIYSLENCTVILADKNRKLSNDNQKKRIIASKGNVELQFDSITEASEQLGISRGIIQACLKSEYQFKYFE